MLRSVLRNRQLPHLPPIWGGQVGASMTQNLGGLLWGKGKATCKVFTQFWWLANKKSANNGQLKLKLKTCKKISLSFSTPLWTSPLSKPFRRPWSAANDQHHSGENPRGICGKFYGWCGFRLSTRGPFGNQLFTGGGNTEKEMLRRKCCVEKFTSRWRFNA